jgi:hypothetical protein
MSDEKKETPVEEEKKPLMNDHQLKEVCAMYRILVAALPGTGDDEDDIEEILTNPSWEMRQRMHPVLNDVPDAREAIGYLRATMHQLEVEWEDLHAAIVFGVGSHIENLRV